MNNTSPISDDDPSETTSYISAYYSVGLSLVLLLLMLFIVFITYYCSKRNVPNGQSRESANNSSMSSHRTVVMDIDDAVTIQIPEDELDAILKGYPMLLYSQAKLHKADSTLLSCSTCLADYKDSEWLRLLPDCGHFFHKECIDMWLRLNLSCPVCRNPPFPSPLPTPLATINN